MITKTNDHDPAPDTIVRTVRYSPNQRMVRHCDGHSRISVVLAGTLRETAAKRREAEVGVLGVAVKSADAPHATQFGPHGACVASIDLDRLIDDDRRSRTRWRWMPGPALDKELRATLTALVEIRAQPAHGETQDGLREACLLLLDRLASAPPHRRAERSWLRSVRERIDDAPQDSPGVTELAGEVGVSTTHLTRCFNAAYGRSVTDYRTLRRIERAVDRLAEPGARLAEVAIETGFHDQAHFTRRFRALIGTTPALWRRRLLTF
ncbi:MAG: AraC family transcriptional regulator [Pseudomonadota bacterium]